MDNIIFFLTIMRWIMNPLVFVLGLLLGILGTLTLTPSAYRACRRRTLRRRWRKDRPQQASPVPLVPQWEEYDPDIPGIGRRCICHHRQLRVGERVLLWPETGPLDLLHIAVYCENVKEPA